MTRTPSSEKKSQFNPKQVQIDQMKGNAKKLLGDQLFEKVYNKYQINSRLINI